MPAISATVLASYRDQIPAPPTENRALTNRGFVKSASLVQNVPAYSPLLRPETDLCIRRLKLRQSAIMLNIRTLDQLAKPGDAAPGIAWKIEHDGIPFDKRAQT